MIKNNVTHHWVPTLEVLLYYFVKLYSMSCLLWWKKREFFGDDGIEWHKTNNFNPIKPGSTVK